MPKSPRPRFYSVPSQVTIIYFVSIFFFKFSLWCHKLTLTLRLLMSYIYGAPSKARNANVVYIWTYVWQR